ncbi:hypothetical protein CTI12_AA080430 [Artemisia annua]|uniref:Uncharacterized protein n=1 Tax=Artemisia annua TaxID=35608 RepID=A0A2U1Q302_ARTAN|nr:hypothetical protein CTI12_AA080430 [Artemisia annua]
MGGNQVLARQLFDQSDERIQFVMVLPKRAKMNKHDLNGLPRPKLLVDVARGYKKEQVSTDFKYASDTLRLLCRWRYGCIYATSTLNGLAFDNTTQAKRRPWPSMVVGECVSPGLLYLSVIWELASVVTVLENVYGFKAMKKGKKLLYGKKKVGMMIAFVMYAILVGLIIVIELFVEYGDDIFELGIVWRVMIGILCGLVLLVWFCLFIVTQTVLYMVCKSFHREAIDKVSLSTLLGVYLGETVVNLKHEEEEVQLGRAQNDSVVAQEV